jgi:hypothetical protein
MNRMESALPPRAGGRDGAPAGATTRAVEGVRFDWAVVALIAWSTLGLYADGWAHNHYGSDLETFFTPWHGLLYSGMAATAALLVAATLRNRAGGLPWRRAVPEGYLASLLGQALFFLGGLGDLLWHVLFGIEADVEALLSPTHLLLAVAGGLIVTGPLRAAWRRPAPPRGWSSQGPLVLSLAYLLSTATFFLQFAHPLERPLAAAGNRPTVAGLPVVAPDPPLLLAGGGLNAAAILQSLGAAGVLLNAALLTGIALLVVRRWGAALPPGALTLLVGLNALAMGAMRDELRLAPALIAAGLAADLLLHALRPDAARPGAFRAFAAGLPALWAAAVFAGAALPAGLWWSVDLWAGTVVLAGIAGYLLSYAFLPPAGRD